MERYFGTLKMVIASPANKFVTFFQRGFIHIIDSLITVIIGLTAGVVLFHVSFNGVNVVLLLFIAFIAMFAAAGLGLALGSLGLITSDMNLVMNTAAMILLTLSGANFPIEKFPYVVQQIAYCMPLTRSIKAANLVMKSQEFNRVYELMIQELGIGVLYILIGYFMLIAMENIARKKALIDIY